MHGDILFYLSLITRTGKQGNPSPSPTSWKQATPTMSPLKKTAVHYPDESFEVEVFKRECVSPIPTKHALNLSYSSRGSARMSYLGDEFLPVDMLPDEACLSPSQCSTSVDGLEPTAEDEQAERDIFDKARQYLNPGPVLRYAIYLFSERKLLTFFLVHFVCTLVVFGRLTKSNSFYVQLHWANFNPFNILWPL